MPTLSLDKVRTYLGRLFRGTVRVLSVAEHDKQELAGDLKGFGYGVPLFIRFTVNGEPRQAVLETMSPSSFGHEHFSDRAQAILWEHGAFNRLPRHVHSLDSGAFLANGDLLSLGEAEELFLLTEFVEGEAYFHDLDRIRTSGTATDRDRARTAALADYLAGIHAEKRHEPGLYARRVRELLGHGECIMGLIDNYPADHPVIGQEVLQRIEHACLDWRWKLKARSHRLAQVHGDFHPWNILFREGSDFTVLDRSRGEWGEPADDVSCLSINYLFPSLLRSGSLEGPFEELHDLFWTRYLERTGDRELPEVAAPFFAWRGLVLASPVWYPHISDDVRSTIVQFIINVLAADRFDHRDMRALLS